MRIGTEVHLLYHDLNKAIDSLSLIEKKEVLKRKTRTQLSN